MDDGDVQPIDGGGAAAESPPVHYGDLRLSTHRDNGKSCLFWVVPDVAPGFNVPDMYEDFVEERRQMVNAKVEEEKRQLVAQGRLPPSVLDSSDSVFRNTLVHAYVPDEVRSKLLEVQGYSVASLDDVNDETQAPPTAAVIGVDVEQPAAALHLLKQLRRNSYRTFVIALVVDSGGGSSSSSSSNSSSGPQSVPSLRLDCFAQGARMIAVNAEGIASALARVASIRGGVGGFECPTCGLGPFDERALAAHFDLWHSSDPNEEKPKVCPICRQGPVRPSLAVHLHNVHGPPEEREPPHPRFPCFAWAIVRRRSDGRFLMTHEPAGIAGGLPRYWLPAGRVDAGETFQQAAKRESREEAAVDVTPIGVLRIAVDNLRRPRVIRTALLCEPADAAQEAATPKQLPDFESCGALWVTADETLPPSLSKNDYRSPTPAQLFPPVARGELQPASLTTPEWAAFESAIQAMTRGPEAQGQGVEAAFDAAWAAVRTRYEQYVKCESE